MPLIYTYIFLLGLIVGSFLNVVILRIPVRESLMKRSHCTGCGHALSWYDMFPLFSFLILRGRCRYCHKKISWQYPVVEFLNGALWVLMFVFLGPELRTILACFIASALLSLSVIDERTHEIPVGFNIFIGVIGLINLALDRSNWLSYILGALSVSLFLYLLFIFSKGRAMGGGDVKLMAAAGLFLGLKLTVLAFFLSLVFATFIHIPRMKIQKKDNELAMGPYLSAGIIFSLWFGESILKWYFSFIL